jgi:FkbM family methyltransferase
MLINFEEIKKILINNNILIEGCFHIGAHDCEELGFYNNIGIQKENVIWIDAIPSKVIEAKNKGIPNVYNAVITDKDNEEIWFNISNNVQSSSVLDFGTHSIEHPTVVYVDKFKTKSITIDTFFEKNNIDNSKLNFWNFDIQGAELLALKGAVESIKYAKAIYLEVNNKELYKGCALIDEIDAFLLKNNFKRVLTNMTIHGWGDALYIVNNNFINNKYSWGEDLYIKFLENNIMDAFGVGNYKLIDNHNITAYFGGKEHNIQFNNNYTNFISIRKDDLCIVKGKLH